MTFYVTDVLNNLPSKARRDVAWTLASSINISVISTLLRHHRAEYFTNDEETPSIDKFNDAIAACNARLTARQHVEEIGFSSGDDLLDIATRWLTIRGWFTGKIAQTEAEDKLMLSFKRRDQGVQPLAESMKFLLSTRRPANDKAIELEAEVHGIPAEALKQAYNASQDRNKAELAKYADAILSTAENLGDDVDDIGESEAEDSFEALPIHMRYNFMVKALQVLANRANRSLQWFTQSSNLDELSNYKLLIGARDALVIAVHDWCEEHQAELSLANEEGRYLSILPDKPARCIRAA